MRLFELYLWAQLGKVWLYVFYGLLIMVTERLTYFVMLVASYLLPVGVLDWFRYQWIRTYPRVLRGFRDPQVTPDMQMTAPELIKYWGYPCEEHYVKVRDGFILGLHRIPFGKSEQAAVQQARLSVLQQHAQRSQSQESDSDSSPRSPSSGSPAASPTPSPSASSNDLADLDRSSEGRSSTRNRRTKARVSPAPPPSSAPAPHPSYYQRLASQLRTMTAVATHSPPAGHAPNPSHAYKHLDPALVFCSPSGPLAVVPPSPDRPRPAVFVMHGFLQSSEAFVSLPNGLPFALADAGFDVWLGNCRGNKYSCKHESKDPETNDYWDFSLDQIAQIDVPAVVEFILRLTGNSKLTYVGFSQGTAVNFAALSVNAELCSRINLFVALAPATQLHGFNNKLVDALTRSSPHIVYLVLGKKRLLPSTTFWQQTLSVKALVKTIDASVRFLFGWDMGNVHPKDKAHHYAHIYSYSSVKSVVQWFQFMSSGRFQMYDDHRWRTQNNKTYIQPCYPLGQISCPIAVFYGGRDDLPDTAALLEQLPADIFVHEEPTFEHLDFMYSREAVRTVYTRVVQLAVAAATHKIGSSVGPLGSFDGPVSVSAPSPAPSTAAPSANPSPAPAPSASCAPSPSPSPSTAVPVPLAAAGPRVSHVSWPALSSPELLADGSRLADPLKVPVPWQPLPNAAPTFVSLAPIASVQ